MHKLTPYSGPSKDVPFWDEQVSSLRNVKADQMWLRQNLLLEEIEMNSCAVNPNSHSKQAAAGSIWKIN